MTMIHVARNARDAEGIYLHQMAPGETFDIRTQNSLYRLRYRGFGAAEISGHSKLCPEPRLVIILGSSWGGSALKTGFLGIGMRLEFRAPGETTVTRTSVIRSISRPRKTEPHSAAA